MMFALTVCPYLLPRPFYRKVTAIDGPLIGEATIVVGFILLIPYRATKEQ